MNKFYVTTPIYYVNDVPHIGSAYPTIAADVLARFYKQIGDESYFLTGTDEHGAKIAQAAQKHNSTPKEYADKISDEFKKAWELLNIDYSRFIRTTDEDHIKTVQEFLQKLFDKGFIEPKPRLYKGLYCVEDEKFVTKEELVNGLCPNHKTKPIEHSEENYYFQLSKFEDQLIKIIESDELKIRPISRKNETLGKLKQGLEDISISRANLSWGVPLPFDKTHTAYVWIDALINYYTYGKEKNIWPADLHIIGKDILWFHAIIWPAMLLAIGEKLPKQISVHGFFTINGEKMSKSIGNVISPEELVNKFGVDGARYLMLTAFPFGDDGDISLEKFTEKYNADLANGLGNLVARVAKLCEKANFCEFKLNTGIDPVVKDFLNKYRFDEALKAIWKKIDDANETVNRLAPWKLEGDELKNSLKEILAFFEYLIPNLEPFLPETAQKIKEQFKEPKIVSKSPLFPRIK